jgi:hypothetical protein
MGYGVTVPITSCGMVAKMADPRNCWEYLACERQPGGKHVSDLGICPAATIVEADGINRGTNGGRICWAIAGTLCCGVSDGVMAHMLGCCLECNFYKSVVAEEPTLVSTFNGNP